MMRNSVQPLTWGIIYDVCLIVWFALSAVYLPWAGLRFIAFLIALAIYASLWVTLATIRTVGFDVTQRRYYPNESGLSV